MTDPSAGEHRVFVDGRSVGHAGVPVTVDCGRRSVRIGSQGITRTVDVPCGGEVRVAR